ncbi:MAG: tyrosine-type recombinase/integrase [Desulfatibacillaceae bacterium]
MEKRVRNVPPVEDIHKVLDAADQDVRDYLLTIWHTMARVSEINALRWDDVNLKDRYVILYTRKKKGGHLTPRKVSMTASLAEVMQRRFDTRDSDLPWVFVNRYRHPRTGEWHEVRFMRYRKSILRTLCRKAGVNRFTFHALRHSGASIMDSANVPTGSIQRILGHENRTTTEIYLHSLGDAERIAIDRFGQLVEKSHTDSHTDLPA